MHKGGTLTTHNIMQQIFIGGCSRSGTTLLGALLGAHSQAICTPESHFKIDVLRSIVADDNWDVLDAADLIRRHWRFKLWETPLDLKTIPVNEMKRSYASLMNYVVGEYAAKLNKPHATIWVDHTPENISYADALLAHFPQAKMIHIVRDGRAVAASIMLLDWGPNSIIKAAQWWMRMTAFGLAVETAIGPKHIVRVRYEDLVLDPERVLRQLCSFLEVDYQSPMTEATGFKPPGYTTGQHALIGHKPDSKVVTRWEQLLTQRQIEIFENLTRDFLSYLGYPLRYGLKAKGPTFFEVRKERVTELLRGGVINKLNWLIRSYPLWLSWDFYKQARLGDPNN